MRFFVDTANPQEIRAARSWGLFSGVTSNPVLMAKESSDYEAHAKTVLDATGPDWDVSFEVRTDTAKAMAAQARILASWDRRVRVKLPSTLEGIQAAALLLKEVRLNMTIIKSAAQGLMCAALLGNIPEGDMVLSIFCGRLRQAGYDWVDIVQTLAQRNSRAKILAASIKTPADLSDAVGAGAHIITAPLDVYKMALSSPLVEEDVLVFNKAFPA